LLVPSDASPYFHHPSSADISCARPRDQGKDWNVPGTEMYGPHQVLGYARFDVVERQTELARFELAVPRPDVPLVLHYLHTVRSRTPPT
jgi:hypothetical protein